MQRLWTLREKTYIEKIWSKQLQTDGFKAELSNKENEAFNSEQIPTSNRLSCCTNEINVNHTTNKAMKNIELNDLIINGTFCLGIGVGLTKFEIEKVLGKPFGTPDIETPDVNYYIIEMATGLFLSIIFDKEDNCFEIRLDLDKSQNLNLIVQLEEEVQKINENTSFEKLINIISRLNVEWEFENKGVYLQTVCIRLKNGLRLYYAFGNKTENDYGLFSIKSILESHKFAC